MPVLEAHCKHTQRRCKSTASEMQWGRKPVTMEIRSEITGNVWKIEVATGTTVAAGDIIAILESMKMEIPVETPVGGVCTLAVSEGDNIQEGDLIARVG